MTLQTATRMNFEPTKQQFSTVSIPDLRKQQLHMIREEAVGQASKESTRDDDRLTAIREAIHRSFDDSNPAVVSRDQQNDWLSSAEGVELSQFGPLVDSIVEEYPAGGTPIIALVATEENKHLPIAVGRTAFLLQSNHQCKILMIDADIENSSLTYRMERAGQPGLTDLVTGKHEWNECIEPTSVDQIDFLPVGRSGFRDSENVANWMAKSMTDFNSNYDYVIVCGGDAHTKHGVQCCSRANAAYLLVNMKSSNQSIAKSAVSHLRSHGARLLGCVVSEAL